jgi:hypothetical protein
MLPLISVVLVILSALGLRRLLPVIRKHRRQVRFIRETLTSSRKSDDRRVIASLSTVPERIGNLGPTIRSLLKQTRPPDEIVLAVPEFSIRERRPYAVPRLFRDCRVCVFCIVAGIGDQPQSLSRSFEKNWRRAGEIHW